MRLYITEKKEVAEALSNALGGPNRPTGPSFQVDGDHITWLWGHLLRLIDPEEHDERFGRWDLSDLPMKWPISHKPEARHASHLKAVITLAKNASEIVNAGDPDPAGQRLVDEVIEFAGLTGKPIKRILINDNNAPAILKAIDAMEDNQKYKGLSMSELAREVCDQRYGYNLTRCYTLLAQAKGYEGVLSVGRVQTCILGMVVARDLAHSSHSKLPYYVIKSMINAGDMTFKVVYVPKGDDPLNDKGQLIDPNFAKKVVDNVTGQQAQVTSVDTVHKEKKAPLPYNLLALQADAVGLWGYKPKRVLEITQSLRDKFKAITYNRSDCRYLNDERHEEAPLLLQALAKIYRQEVSQADANNKSKAFNSAKVGAHHAIIPTMNVPELEGLSSEERNIYDLISRSYIAQFYAPEKFRITNVTFDVVGHHFKGSGRVNISPGWTVLYDKSLDASDSEDPNLDVVNFESFKPGDTGNMVQATVDKSYSQPPPLYTMKTLLKDLARVAKYVTDPKIKAFLLAKDQNKGDESGGIGTPATRDSHLDTLFKRGFFTEKGKHVISTEIGKSFHDVLPSFAVKPDLTALWHEKQKQIEVGELDYQHLIDEVDQTIALEIQRVKAEGLKLNIKIDPTQQCPTCKKGALRKRTGGYGAFWGCSRYPDCKAKFPNKRGKPDLSEKTPLSASTEHKCPDCHQGLVRRPAKKKGFFWWGCSGFPSCSYRTFDKNGLPVRKA